MHQTCNNNNELLSNIGFFGSKTLYEGKGNDICGIIIKGVSVADAGYWKCELEYYDLKAQKSCMTWDAILVQVILDTYIKSIFIKIRYVININNH